MKKCVLFIAVVLMAFSAYGQEKANIRERIQKLEESGQAFIMQAALIYDGEVSGKESGPVTKGSFFKLNKKALKDWSSTQSNSIRFEIPMANGDPLRFKLLEFDLLTPDFQVSISESGGEVFPYKPGKYYHGVIDGERGSFAAISVFEDKIMGVVESESRGNLILGPMDSEEDERYVLYSTADFSAEMPFECGTNELGDVTKRDRSSQPIPEGGAVTNNCVRAYLECDYDMFVEKGSVQNVVDYMTGLYNVVALLYSNDNMSTTISEIFVWNTPDGYATNTPSSALNSFRNYRTNFNGDVGHLVSRGAPTGGGVAWVDVLCTSYNYAYSYIYSSYNAFPTYSWSVNVIAHEMGHNIAAWHTHDCEWTVNGVTNQAIDGCGNLAGYPGNGNCPSGPIPSSGTVMSYCHLLGGIGIDFNEGFHPIVAGVMQSAIDGAGCLTACTNCNASVSLTLTEVTCHGGNNGAITANATGGPTPYSYAWSNGATSQTITGLVAGNYSVTVTDAEDCAVTASASLGEPGQISLSTNVVDETFPGASNGSIDLTINGGTPPYSFQWSNGATSEDLSGLSSGNYSVTVTDNSNCVETTSAIVGSGGCGTVVSNFPYSESFETGLGDWTQNTGDNIDWTRNSGSTPSSGTGPSGAINGTYYMFVEASGNPGALAELTSPCFDLTNLVNPEFHFSYHMYGLDMGSLTLSVSTDNGANWTSIWTAFGDKGNSWHSASVSLSNYVSPITKLRIGGVVGPNYRSDMAIDHISIDEENVPCTPPSVTISKNDVSCHGMNDGSASADISGGIPPYSFLWSNGATSQSIQSLAAGTFQVTVEDQVGCQVSGNIQILEPTALQGSISTNPVSCNGGNDGTASVSVSGGTSPYTYSWSNGSTSQQLNGLHAGGYSVTISDNNGCIEVESGVVAEPGSIQASFTVVDETLPGAGNGSISTTVSGGVTPYTYLWSNGATTKDINGLTSGIYTITITDGNGCVYTGSAEVFSGSCNQTITNYPYFEGFEIGIGSWTQDAGDQIDWTRNSGGTVSSGTGPDSAFEGAYYMYAEASGNPGASAGLTSTCLDLVGLVDPELHFSYHMYGLDMGSLSVKVSVDNGGSWTELWSATGDQGNIWHQTTIALNNFQTPNTRVKFEATIGTNHRSDIAIDAVELREAILPCSPPGLSFTATNVSCAGWNDGSATVNPNGGLAPYTYTWSNGGINQTISNLSSGQYSVTVTDANNCDVVGIVSISEPSAISTSISVMNETFPGTADGSIDLMVSGGNPTYNYQWSNGATTEDISGLSAGVYTVTITDQSLCTFITSAEVQAGSCGGSVSNYPYGESFEGGLGLWSQDSGDQINWIRNSGSTPSSDTGPSSAYDGSFYLFAEASGNPGANAGITSPCFDLSSLNNPELSFSYHMYGADMGTLEVQVSIDNGATWIELWSSNGNQGDLWHMGNVDLSGYNSPATKLKFLATIGNNYRSDIAIDAIAVEESIPPCSPPALSIVATDVSCFSGGDGSATVNVSGGMSPYVYQWSNGATTANISSLASGIYTVTVTDALNCSSNTSVTIAEPTPLNASFAVVNETFPGAANGELDLTISGGTPPYSFNWSNGATTEDISSLTAGIYTVTITDDQGCVLIGSEEVSTGICDQLISTFPYEESFETGMGFWTQDTDDDFNWTRDSGGTPSSGTGPNSGFAGAFYLYTEASGNPYSTASITSPCLNLDQLAYPQLSFAYHMYGIDIGSLTLLVSTDNGGTWVELWTMSGNQGNSWYDVVIPIDQYKSSATKLKFVGNTGPNFRSDMAIDAVNISDSTPPCNKPAVSLSGTDVSCFGGADGTANATVSGGQAPYSYLWSNGATSSQITGLTSGTYELTVTDALNCTNTASLNIAEPTPISLTFQVIDESYPGALNGEVTTQLSGGDAPYEFAWSNGETTQNLTGLQAGTYSVTVTDVNSCMVVEQVVIGLSGCDVLVSNFPYDVSFEGGMEEWEQSGADQMDWTRRSGQTPSNGTGPNSAFDGNFYLYTESSGNSNKSAILTSPCLNLTGVTDPVLSFAYHMYGRDIGSLRVEVSTDNGNTWTQIWSKIGEQGNAWYTDSVSLEGYKVTATKLRFVGQTGNGFRSDLAIDKIQVDGFVPNCNQPIISIVKSDVGCHGGTDGAVELMLSGGTAPYEILWSTGDTSANIENLAAGTYHVSVTDQLNCPANESVVINQPSAIVLDFNVLNESFAGASDGSIDLIVQGGTNPYTYIWSNGANSEDISALSAGTYLITVTDNNGCDVSESAMVVVAPQCTPYAGFPYFEGFEQGLGQWVQDPGDAFDWSRRSGKTPSNATGPNGASQGNFYIYTEATGQFGTAILESPCVDLAGTNSPELNFDYHMYGNNMGSLALEISLDGGNSWMAYWSRSGNQGIQWLSYKSDLSAYVGQTVKFRFKGTIGNGFRSDMAVDAFSISEPTNAPAGFVLGKVSSNLNLETLFPNPASDDLKVELSGLNKGVVIWTVMDPLGKVVKNGKLDVADSTYELPLSVSDLNAGYYLLTFSNEGQTVTGKLVVQRN